MARKFIIEGDDFKIGHVGFHRELAADPKKVLGGGYWAMDRVQNKLFLFSKSEDFGSLTIEQLRTVKEKASGLDSWNTMEWYFKEGQWPKVEDWETEFEKV